MKSRFTFFVACTLVITMMGGVNAQDITLTQPPSPSEAARAEALLLEIQRGQRAARNPVQEAHAHISEAFVQIQEAKSDEEKQAARAKLGEALGKIFDADIEKRKTELLAIRQRLEQMQKQLQRRIDNKKNIITLRAQVLTSQAEGLGWQGGGGRRGTREFDRGIVWPTLPQPSTTVGAPIGLEESGQESRR